MKNIYGLCLISNKNTYFDKLLITYDVLYINKYYCLLEPNEPIVSVYDGNMHADPTYEHL